MKNNRYVESRKVTDRIRENHHVQYYVQMRNQTSQFLCRIRLFHHDGNVFNVTFAIGALIGRGALVKIRLMKLNSLI